MLDCKFITLLLVTSCVFFDSREKFFVAGKTKIVQTTIMGSFFSWMKELIMADEDPEYEFPDSLEGFGYHFNKDGQMRSNDGDEPFKFQVEEGNQVYNQKHYNALGEIITQKIYSLLETDCQLQRKYIPDNAEENQPRSFVFISKDFYTNKDKLMILIHGNGVVRAGQWARRLIINDCLDSGTQIPYIKWAMKNGYAVIVANPNLNHVESKQKRKRIPIKGNSSPEEHTETMWKEFVTKSPASNIAIVAHSYGGVGTVELSKNHLEEFQDRVFAIAFTDSVHSLISQKAEPEVVEFYKERVINWASAYDPLDAPLINTRDQVVTVSAGTDKHEYTSFSSMNSIFKYFTEKYEKATKAIDSKQPESDDSGEQPVTQANAGNGEESEEKSTNPIVDSNIDSKEPKESEKHENSSAVSPSDVDVKSEL